MLSEGMQKMNKKEANWYRKGYLAALESQVEVLTEIANDEQRCGNTFAAIGLIRHAQRLSAMLKLLNEDTNLLKERVLKKAIKSKES